MVTIGMNYRVIEGKQKIFEDAFAKVLKAMEGMAGHSRSQLYRAVTDPQLYLVMSEWSDKAAFDAFVGSDQFRAVITWGKEQILSTRPEHHIYGTEQG